MGSLVPSPWASNSHPAGPITGSGGGWWIFDDGNPPVKFDKDPLVVQENCCLLWLNCMPHGGAEPVSLMAEESPVLSDEEKVNRIIHDLTINDDCAAKGFRPWMVWMLAS